MSRFDAMHELQFSEPRSATCRRVVTGIREKLTRKVGQGRFSASNGRGPFSKYERIVCSSSSRSKRLRSRTSRLADRLSGGKIGRAALVAAIRTGIRRLYCLLPMEASLPFQPDRVLPSGTVCAVKSNQYRTTTGPSSHDDGSHRCVSPVSQAHLPRSGMWYLPYCTSFLATGSPSRVSTSSCKLSNRSSCLSSQRSQCGGSGSPKRCPKRAV